MSDQTGLYQDGNSVFENVFIQGTLNVATANEQLVVSSDGISIDTITTKSNGRVGIHSNIPAATLDIRDVGSTGPGILISGCTGAEGDLAVQEGEILHVGHFNIDTSNFTERVRITTGGNIEIGSLVDPGDTLRFLNVANFNTGSSAGSILRLNTVKSDGTSSTSADIVKYKTGGLFINNNEDIGTAGFISFGTATNGGSTTEKLRITSAGFVGINSSIPAATLDVIGSIRKTEYEPGEIIETLIGVCDGNDVTVKSGTYTLEDVNTDQVLTDTHTTIAGSSIEYVPPAGTTRVCYEFWVYMKDTGSGNGSRPLVHFQSQLDNSSGNATIIDNSRHTWRFASSTNVQDVQTWVYNKVTVSIGQVTTESVANGRLVNWNSARTFRWTARRYSSSYQGQFHETNNWNGQSTDIRVRPHVKITAIA